ncbi:MAG: chromate transporter [Clostridia bacterium]|nr:chromate transporter [Clostridia bacterium]
MEELFRIYLCFLKIGAFLFGGGYSMLPMLIRELSETKKWATEDELMDYFAVAQCTPGVIAINTATFVGYKLKKVPGSIAATLGIVTVPVIVIILVASVLKQFWGSPAVAHAFNGIRVAVAALIASAVIKLGKKSIHNWLTALLCAAAFASIAFMHVSPVIVVVAVALAGILYGRAKQA